MASSWVRDLIIDAALSRMRDRSMGGVDDQPGNAFEEDSTAASREDGEEVCIVAIFSDVEGSIAGNVFESLDD